MTQFAHTDLAPGADEAWPHYDDAEIAAVTAVLRSGRVNQWTGDTVRAFQDAWSGRFRSGPAIALANGSLALELPLRAYGIGPGDEVIVTPRTFVASAFCARLVGAIPVFADIDPDSGNITAETIARVLTPRSRAVIPVHLGGWPCDMPAIMDVARRHGLLVIEDCAQAHGAEIGGSPVGSFGDVAAFSFCQDKIISTGGEGGLTSFRDEARWRWAWSFKDHGKNPDKIGRAQATPGFQWLHDQVGTNWRLTGLQAAIGLEQLAKLDAWREARTRNAMVWAEALADIAGLRVPLPEAHLRHAFYKFYVYVEGDRPAGARDAILKRAADCGLRLFSGSCSEVYREKAFADLPAPDLPNARALQDASLMMEVHPTLDPDRLRRRAEALAAIMREVLA